MTALTPKPDASLAALIKAPSSTSHLEIRHISHVYVDGFLRFVVTKVSGRGRNLLARQPLGRSFNRAFLKTSSVIELRQLISPGPGPQLVSKTPAASRFCWDQFEPETSGSGEVELIQS